MWPNPAFNRTPRRRGLLSRLAAVAAASGLTRLVRRQPVNAPPILESTVTCPDCGFAATEIMPIDACLYFYECQGCRRLLRPKAGDCCVFCSYGSIKCLPVQLAHGSL